VALRGLAEIEPDRGRNQPKRPEVSEEVSETKPHSSTSNW